MIPPSSITKTAAARFQKTKLLFRYPGTNHSSHVGDWRFRMFEEASKEEVKATNSASRPGTHWMTDGTDNKRPGTGAYGIEGMMRLLSSGTCQTNAIRPPRCHVHDVLFQVRASWSSSRCVSRVFTEQLHIPKGPLPSF